MRKSILSGPKSPDPQPESTDARWLDLEKIARVELSSEDAQHPFEHALRPGVHDGWRAAEPGPQTIRLHFDEPQSILRIRLQFREDNEERSQEFALFATSANHQRRNIVRQQWTFSPGHSSIEDEDYAIDLRDVSAIELEIDPGRHDKQVIATLHSIAIFR